MNPQQELLQDLLCDEDLANEVERFKKSFYLRVGEKHRAVKIETQILFMAAFLIKENAELKRRVAAVENSLWLDVNSNS